MNHHRNCLNTQKAVKDLLVYVSSHLDGATEFDYVRSPTLEVQTLDKSKIIAEDGKIYLNTFWLQKGYGRFFKLETNNEGITEEMTIDFCRPGEMIFVKEIFANESSKEYHFQLAAGAVIIPLEEGCLPALNLTELQIARLIGKVMASDKSEYFRRMDLMKLNPRERYKQFLSHFGIGIEHYFLIKQIACFLKMRPSYLSRLRGELLRKRTV